MKIDNELSELFRLPPMEKPGNEVIVSETGEILRTQEEKTKHQQP
jgi:hypothetical protein